MTTDFRHIPDRLALCADFSRASGSHMAVAVSSWYRDDVTALQAEVERLLSAIREHHGQKADDRCIFDDDHLYAAAGLPPVDRRVGDKAAMLKNCERFIDRRCEGGGWPSYAELEAENVRLLGWFNDSAEDNERLTHENAGLTIEAARLTAELATLRTINQGFADRIAAQSDQLGQNAEKIDFVAVRALVAHLDADVKRLSAILSNLGFDPATGEPDTSRFVSREKAFDRLDGKSEHYVGGSPVEAFDELRKAALAELAQLFENSRKRETTEAAREEYTGDGT